jgi:hypothetical protein
MSHQIQVDQKVLEEILKEIAELKKLVSKKPATIYLSPAEVEKK